LKAGAEPAIVSPGVGRLELFAVAEADGQVHQRSYSGGAWSAKWSPSPGAAARRAGRPRHH